MSAGAREYIPDSGDLIWIDFDPQTGHEQAGRRPGLVLSPAAYNGRSGLAIVCPVTSHIKGYPFEVPLPAGLKVNGAVLADHAKNIDWKARKAQKCDSAPASVTRTVKQRLLVLIG
ncbi:MAG: endoribonuclease MazF [Acidobacteriaceae bacterium]